LAVLAAVTALGAACVGCQSVATTAPGANTDAFAMRPGSGQSSHRLLSFLHRTPDRQDPPPAIAAYPPAPVNVAPFVQPHPVAATPAAPAAQPAVLLKPVPSGGNSSAVIASTWQPVQHLAVESSGPDLSGANPGTSRSVALEGGGVGVQCVVDLAPPQLMSVADKDDPKKGEKDDKDETLGAPRVITPQRPTDLPYTPTAALQHGPPAVPKEFAKQALPPYVVEPPDILLIEAAKEITHPLQPLAGQHLIRPDGSISLGLNGRVFVAGMTIDQVKDAIAVTLQAGPARKFSLAQIKDELNVDVLAYNSKFYYIITDGGGYGAQIYRLPATGNETVMDALAQINGLPTVASKKQIWLARAIPGDYGPPKVFPIDWCGMVKRGSAETNYQVYPGDRIYVESDPWIRGDTWLSKRLSPVLRGFGATLLGATTVNTIKNGSNPGGGGGVR
jgi:polysaccharide export outer membrane protein